MRLALFLSPLVLLALYVFVITPVALLSRLFRRDPLRLAAPKKDGGTFWEDRPPQPDAASYLRQY